jgi:uncharacterized protein YjbI with pentapeptide repeats
MNESSKLDAWKRLSQGKGLDGLPLGTRGGRIDLGGLILPDVSAIGRYRTPIADVAETNGGAVLRGCRLKGLDFTGSKLPGIRLFDCEIQDCRFDACQLEGLRVWSSRFSETSFRAASLRKAVLGGVQDGRRNIFSNVDFTEADLRQSIYKAASFEGCVFGNAKLVKIDFQTSTFSDCTFEGELREVIFCRRGFKGDSFPANEMKNVDFSRARLHFVEFRGLSLDHVRLPNDAEHIIVTNYVETLDRMLDALRVQDDPTARTLAGLLGNRRKWAAPDQFQGVLNIEDLREIAGEDGVQRVLSLLHTSGSKVN